MELTIDEKKKMAHISIKENIIDFYAIEELSDLLNNLLERGKKKIELDLSDVRVIDSSGIGQLIFFKKKFANINNGNLVIISLSKELENLFRSAKLDELLEI